MSARDVLACFLDHPSVFMGGPSERNQRKADAILAALSAAGLVVEQGWQPIETAPQDQMVLVYSPSPDPTLWHTSVCDLSPIICAAKWHPEGGWCVCEIREVTHWRPLPAAPQEERNDGR